MKELVAGMRGSCSAHECAVQEVFPTNHSAEALLLADGPDREMARTC